LFTLEKTCWTRVLGSVVIQLNVGKCTPSVDRAYKISISDKYMRFYAVTLDKIHQKFSD